jgi:preprotein translocase subunit SecG
MGTLFTVIILIACVALILFVLVQNPKGGGLNSEFGSAVQLGGAKRATDILEKGTWGLAIAIAVICLGMAAGGSSSVSTPEEEFGTDVESIQSDDAGATDNSAPAGGIVPPMPQ